MGDKGGKKDKDKNKQQQLTKQKQEDQNKHDKAPARTKIARLGSQDRPVFRLPHRVFHLFKDVSELSICQTFCPRRLGDGGRHRHRNAP